MKSISCHHEKDGTLVVTVPKGTNVGRVLIQEEGTCIGSLYYPDHFADISKMYINLPSDLQLTRNELATALQLPWDKAQLSEENATSDCISRQAAIDALDGEITITGKTNAEAVRDYVNAVKGRLERIPPIQPKRGKYKAVVCDGVDLLACSECGYTGAFWSYNFCPNCGADMRGGEDAIHG